MSKNLSTTEDGSEAKQQEVISKGRGKAVSIKKGSIEANENNRNNSLH